MNTGNLPFTADVASITKHFASIKPKSVRALSEKGNPTKGRGIAFIEFENYDHMKTCLKLFHHSMFDDGKSAPRQINCELTYVSPSSTRSTHPPTPFHLYSLDIVVGSS